MQSRAATERLVLAGACSQSEFEGLFEVHKELRKPRVLVFGPRGSIAYIRANTNLVAWIVDVGPDMLAVDMLALRETAADAAVQPR